MLILANTLNFNGGTTFILRMAKALRLKGMRLGVLVLTKHYDEKLFYQIEEVADIFFLSDYVPWLFATGTQLDIFMPYQKERLLDMLTRYGGHVHAIGIFGLLFVGVLMKRTMKEFCVSVGVYHQNEFMYKGVDSFFSNIGVNIFKKLPKSNVVFYNENSKIAYSSFFDMNYAPSPLLPIGIEIPEIKEESIKQENFRIISVGNLYPFKTYNQHVISCMPKLLAMNSEVTYEIYGEGGNEQALRQQVNSLGLEASVFFKGRVKYDELNGLIQGSFLFVGSGTAILEAAVLGVPALIGIESAKEPVTYGFLSKVEGFSYHEEVEGKEKFQMQDMISSILLNEGAWEKEALACRDKAKAFSIQYTLLGFEQIESKYEKLSLKAVRDISIARLLASFLWASFKHKLKLDTKFANRRNQGSL